MGLLNQAHSDMLLSHLRVLCLALNILPSLSATKTLPQRVGGTRGGRERKEGGRSLRVWLKLQPKVNSRVAKKKKPQSQSRLTVILPIYWHLLSCAMIKWIDHSILPELRVWFDCLVNGWWDYPRTMAKSHLKNR